MGTIDSVSWKKFEKFLYTVGCKLKREKGGHRIYWKPGLSRPIVVQYGTTVPVFIILNNLRILGCSREEFLKIIAEL